MARQMTIPVLILLVVAGLLSPMSLAQTPPSISSADVAAMINQATSSGTANADLDDALDQLSEGPASSSKADIVAALNQYDTHTATDTSLPPSLPRESLGDTIGNDGATNDAAPVGSTVVVGAFPPQQAGFGGSAASGPSSEKHASSTSILRVTYISAVAIVAGFFTI